MITGFNTDIEFEGVTYHIQTEDKGLDTPLILSLVYDRGTILASKRSSYEDLLNDKFDEKALTQRLQKQHKLICAAVRAGRIEDLKRMTEKDSAERPKTTKTRKKETVPAVSIPKKIPVEKPDFAVAKNEIPPKNPYNAAVNSETPSVPIPKPTFDEIEKSAPLSHQTANGNHQSAQPIQTLRTPSFEIANEIAKNDAAIPKPKQEEIWDFPIKSVEIKGEEYETIIEAVEIIEEEDEETIIPAEAVEIVGDYVQPEPPVSRKLLVEFLTETAFRGGERKTVSIIVSRGGKKGVSGAQIMVKVLGSSFRPLIFHAKTDSNGIAVVHLQLPHFRAGRAAILVRGMSDGEEAELRRVVSHG